MAINTIMFSQYADTAALMAGVKTIIDGYGFFDTTTIDSENNTLTCTVDGVDFMVMTFTGKTISTLLLTSQYLATFNCDLTSGGTDPEKIITTSKGIAILSIQQKHYGLYIGKTKNGAVAAHITGYINSQAFISADFSINSISPPKLGTSKKLTENCNITTLTNVPITTGNDIFNDVFFVISSENATEGNYMLNGTNYYSDGYVMLAD